MRLIISVLGLAMLIGCSARSDRMKHESNLFAASSDRTTLAYIDNKHTLVRLRGTERLEIPLASHPGCEAFPDGLSLSPEGDLAFLYGNRGNMEFDLFGHAGRHVEIACWVDFKSGFVHVFGDAVKDELPTRGEVQWVKGNNNLVFAVNTRASMTEPLVIIDLAQETARRLSLDPKSDRPRGFSGLCFADNRGALRLFCLPSGVNPTQASRFVEDGNGVASQPFEWPRLDVFKASFSPDGGWLGACGSNEAQKSVLVRKNLAQMDTPPQMIPLPQGCVALEFEKDGSVLAVLADTSLKDSYLVRIASDGSVKKLYDFREYDVPRALYLSADGQSLWVDDGFESNKLSMDSLNSR